MRQGVMRKVAAAALVAAGLDVASAGAAPAEEPAAAGPASAPAASATAAGDPEVAEGIVGAPAAEVWSVFATAEGFTKLGVAKCELDLRPGGLIRTHYDPAGVIGDEGTITNEILAYEPERMISFRIKQPPKGFPFSEATWRGTWSVVTLGDLGDGRTHVRLAGLGYTDTEESRKMREFFRAGNAWTLQRLAARLDASAPSPAGPAHPARSVAPIRHERVLEMPRAEAWRLYATSEGWKRFMGVEARIELRPDGPFEILFGATAPEGQKGSEGCTVLSVLPGEMLSHSWNAPPSFPHARERRTWVVVTFEELAPLRTRVRLDHLGFAEQAAANPDHLAEWEDVRAYFASAWGKVLDALTTQEKGAAGTAT